jgi:uroporphyrinogen-III decarboxylase
MFKIPSDAQKQEVWQRYWNRRPERVPLNWSVNPRIILLNPALNPERFTFRDYFNEPRVTLAVQARFQEYRATELSRTSDTPAALPDNWTFYVDNQNIYDAAYFGADVCFEDDQVPSTLPCFTAETANDFLKRDYSRWQENPWIRDRQRFHAALTREAASYSYLGRSGTVSPFFVGFDGPLTIATNLFGADIFTLLGEDPDKAVRILEFITRAAITRTREMDYNHHGRTVKGPTGYLADDSIQLISTSMYEERVLPLHALWYDEISDTRPATGGRSIHLCGDATRHFPLIHSRLGVDSFDTGFPVDHGALRQALGPDVEISGGPKVSLLKNSSPDDCFRETARILQSGIKEGGRFILKEANNLPPCVPPDNLAAVYRACHEFGTYD